MGHEIDFEAVYPDDLVETQELEATDEVGGLEALLDFGPVTDKNEDLAEIETAIRSIQMEGDYSPKPVAPEPEPKPETEPISPESHPETHNHKVEVVIHITDDKKAEELELVENQPIIFDPYGDDRMRGDLIVGHSSLVKEKDPAEFSAPPVRRR